MKRRAAVELSIGHLKNEHRLERNRLRGTYGDAINAVPAAAAMNFHKLLGAFWLYLELFGSIFCAACWASGAISAYPGPLGPQMPCETT